MTTSKLINEQEIEGGQSFLADKHLKLINSRIEKLRPKLLDLTRQNPLLSSRLTEKSNSIIRIVDEVPSNLLATLSTHAMRFVPLPELEADPLDESDKSFQYELAEARITNEVYLQELEKINQSSDEAAGLLVKADRKLKDFVRAKLNMPARQNKTNLSLQQHAQNHGINPSYELPTIGDIHEDGRHSDLNIQTLLLPDMLEKKLNALLTKEKTWQEEAGISVLQVVFGFLEWQEQENAKLQYSPLILMPIELEKKRTMLGHQFIVIGDETEIAGNEVLAIKMRLELGIEMPKFNKEEGIENYFERVEKQRPKNSTWRIRRWVAFGVFPSARLAMYHDLAPDGWDFAKHDITRELLIGSEANTGNTPFGDEYEIDEPATEKKAFTVITDADASQLSTMVDVLDGKNVAVEGPPGTGKSQTIVNTIAAALGAGKKVLFVAEKSAALDVVKSRLEAFGLGEFLLSLQAKKSTKSQVVDSIRERIEMGHVKEPVELENLIKTFTGIRDKLKRYVDILKSSFGETDYTVHQILGACIKYRRQINNLQDVLKKITIPNVHKLTSSSLQQLELLFANLENSWEKIYHCEEYWQKIGLENLDPFKAEEILQQAFDCHVSVDKMIAARKQLSRFKIDENTDFTVLDEWVNDFKALPLSLESEDVQIAKGFNDKWEVERIRYALENFDQLKELKKSLSQYFSTIERSLTGVIEKALQLLTNSSLNELNIEEYNRLILSKEQDLEEVEAIKIYYQSLAEIDKEFLSLKTNEIVSIVDSLKGLSKADRKFLMESLDDKTIHGLINDVQKKCLEIKTQEAELNKIFLLPQIRDRDVIFTCYQAITAAGFFSFLSKDFSKAKKFFKTVSLRRQKFQKKQAVEDLALSLYWQDNINSVSNDKRLQTALGSQFHGIDTAFDCIQKVIEHFSNIDKSLPDFSHEKIKLFLKFGESEKLNRIPPIEINHPIRKRQKLSYSEIVNAAVSLSNSIINSKAGLSNLVELKKTLLNPDEVSTHDLRQINTDLKNFWDIEGRLFTDEALIKEKLGIVSDFPNINTEKYLRPLQILDIALKYPSFERETFYSLIDSNKWKEFVGCIDDLHIAYSDAIDSVESFANVTKMDSKTWLGYHSFSIVSMRFLEASKDREGLLGHSRFIGIVQEIKQLGYDGLVTAILSSGERSKLPVFVRSLVFREMAKEIYARHGSLLGSYNGETLDISRMNLRDVDKKIIILNREKLRAQLKNKAIIPTGISHGRKSDYTDMGLINHQISLKKRHCSVRDLTIRAGRALSEIKPCWMMSPLAVAQYIPRGSIRFDLVIIDEASQMTPEDSLGALVRAKQAMIVGDTNQLPPSNFFKKVLEDEEADENEKITEESILEMANMVFKPRRRLRWHYRSRHSGLISFSNHHIYDDKLVVFPSAHENHPEMGVRFVKVNGLYSAGTNPEEAKAIVEAILVFMAKSPHLSLGVVVLNIKQKELITEHMNLAFENNLAAQEYKVKWEIEKDGLEQFFIKNLENVQGDERDVIFIGTVYGSETVGGRVMQRFGPITGVAGKRRLNVLFTRAKRLITTFSSMNSTDILAEEGNPGAFLLKKWLEYSATGILHVGEVSNKEPDSEFEEHVIEVIKSLGCEAIPQVGVKGYSIDIGVRHHSYPNGFILGVECDGASYHSSKSARDRDRLRQDVLEGLGWKLFRIWSTDWFESPVREGEKLRAIILERLNELVR